MREQYEWGPEKQDANLTKEAIAEARALISVELRRTLFNTEASRRTISQFVRGIGDTNPLFLEEEYGRATQWGCMIAPSIWLYTVDLTDVAPKLRGIHSIYCGTGWQFFRPIRIGDTFSVKAKLVDVIEKQGRFCGKMVLQVGEVTYTNQFHHVVAVARSKVMRTTRAAAREKGKYKNVTKYTYSPQELQEIEDAYDREKRQGDQLRYWDDVKVGDELPRIVRGPLSAEDMLCFIQATKTCLTGDMVLNYYRRHPADSYINPATGLRDMPVASLIDDDMAHSFGFPGAHDTGVQRICWLSNLMTNWMGNDGFLQSLNVDLLLPNMYGDTTWCKGKVINKSSENGKYRVQCQIWAENQRGETTAHGEATVSLPSRNLDCYSFITG